jgi:hypothetical protein
MGMDQIRPVKIFYSYAHEDERYVTKLRNQLKILKRQGLIEEFHDRQIAAGMDWEATINEHLENSDIILLLISDDFIASDYCWGREMMRALARHRAGEARVIPIAIRDVDWKGAPFAMLQGLPRDMKPITQWPDPDGAFRSISESLRQVIGEINMELQRPLARSSSTEKPKNSSLERMILALKDPRYEWRSIERLAVISGLNTEDEALAILRDVPEVKFSKGKSGRIIARLEKAK